MANKQIVVSGPLSLARQTDREENELQYALGLARRKGTEIATLNEVLMQKDLLGDLDSWRGGLLIVSSEGAPKTRGFHIIDRRDRTLKYAKEEDAFKVPWHDRVHIDLTTAYTSPSAREAFANEKGYAKLGYVPDLVVTSKKEHLVFLGHFPFAGEGLGVAPDLKNFYYPIKVALRTPPTRAVSGA